MFSDKPSKISDIIKHISKDTAVSIFTNGHCYEKISNRQIFCATISNIPINLLEQTIKNLELTYWDELHIYI